MAGELGMDKIFGKGTTPGEVASYLAYALAPGAGPQEPPAASGQPETVSAQEVGATA
jgi:beta-lysine 5,6-aminomutase beta subunit